MLRTRIGGCSSHSGSGLRHSSHWLTVPEDKRNNHLPASVITCFPSNRIKKHTLLPEERCSLVDQCILGGAGERQVILTCSIVFIPHYNKPWVAMVLSCRFCAGIKIQNDRKRVENNCKRGGDEFEITP